MEGSQVTVATRNLGSRTGASEVDRVDDKMPPGMFVIG